MDFNLVDLYGYFIIGIYCFIMIFLWRSTTPHHKMRYLLIGEVVGAVIIILSFESGFPFFNPGYPADTIAIILSPVFPLLCYFVISKKGDIATKSDEEKTKQITAKQQHKQEKQQERERAAAAKKEAERQRREAEEQAVAAKIEAERQQREAEERQRLDKLKKLIRVSETLQISQVGEYLGLQGQELFNRLVDWAAEFGFTLDQQLVKFGAGRKDDFIAALDKEFMTWSKRTGGKV